jgi:hypothetical protein
MGSWVVLHCCNRFPASSRNQTSWISFICGESRYSVNVSWRTVKIKIFRNLHVQKILPALTYLQNGMYDKLVLNTVREKYKMDTPIFYRSWFAFNLRLWKWILHFCRRRNTYLHLSRDCVLYLINLLTQFHIITNIYINIIIEQYLIYPFSRALFWCINNKLWLIFFSEFNICVTFTLSLDFKIKDVCVIVIWQYYYVPPIAPNLNIKNYILL